jgi:hypothetical protein
MYSLGMVKKIKQIVPLDFSSDGNDQVGRMAERHNISREELLGRIQELLRRVPPRPDMADKKKLH